MVEDLRPGEHASRIDQQVPQQAELGARQIDRLAGPQHLVCVFVELEVGEHQVAGGVAVRGLVPAKDDADPGHQLLDAEGLGHVVVAADGEAAHLLFGGVSGGEEDHRHLEPVGDQALGEAEAVLVGQADVEHDQCRPVLHHRPAGVLGAGGGLHRETLVFEGHRHQVGDGTLVVDDENTGRGVGHGPLWCPPTLGICSESAVTSITAPPSVG